MYFRVTTVSDLLTADGQFYDKNLIHGKRSQTNPNPSFFRYHWPNLPSPSPKEKDIWFQHIMTHLSMDQHTQDLHGIMGQRSRQNGFFTNNWSHISTHWCPDMDGLEKGYWSTPKTYKIGALHLQGTRHNCQYTF
mmetsp:Transcript_14153/g.26573  ORF Transcript_14153/g.26573 Transcript_14153/m.26573 type:complete len:135 (-) Transcript_14153:195-599(-)